MFASINNNREIELWDINTGQRITTFRGHTDIVKSLVIVSSLTFSLNGKTLFSSGWDQTIKVWQLETGEEISSIKVQSGKIQTMAIASNHQTLVSGSDDGRIDTWRCYF